MDNGINNLREFGKFRLDPFRRVLWHEGEPVNLALKEIELLCLLTENSGEVLTKTELLDRVWPDSFVEDSNLSRHIYVLRKTFKDLGESEDLIKTVPRRGYRFAGEVKRVPAGELVIEKHTQTRTLIEVQEAVGQSNGAWQRGFSSYRLAAIMFVVIVAAGGFAVWNSRSPAAGSPPAPGIRSIAVMPFKTIGEGSDNVDQGLGLADVLITRLSRIKALNVRPTSAVLNLRNQDSKTAGERLKVDVVLEGTVHRLKDKVRVTARLVKVSDGSTTWAGDFEKLPQDEMRLQNEIALQIVNTLTPGISVSEKTALTKRYTENPDAYQLYLRGRFEWNKRNWDGVTESQRLFRNAIEKDPGFTLAYVGLADAIGTSSQPSEAFRAVSKALELDPNFAEAHATMGFLQMFHSWKWKEAEESFKRSIELNPGYATAHHWYATLLAIKGRNTEAKAEMKRALEIDPLSHNFLADLGQLHYFAGEYDEAKAHCEKALEIYPDFVFAHEYLADIYIQTGPYDKAVEHQLAARKINESYSIQTAEEKQSLEARLDRLRKTYQNDIKGFLRSGLVAEPKDAFGFYHNAVSYAVLGEKEKALDNLEKACEHKAFLAAFIKADPLFEELRREPRFNAILRRMNLAD